MKGMLAKTKDEATTTTSDRRRLVFLPAEKWSSLGAPRVQSTSFFQLPVVLLPRVGGGGQLRAQIIKHKYFGISTCT